MRGNDRYGTLSLVALVCVCLILAQPAAAFDWSRTSIAVGGGYGDFSPDGVNEDYINGVGRMYNVFNEHVKPHWTLSAEGGYARSDRLSLHLGMIYIHGSTSHDWERAAGAQTPQVEASEASLRLRVWTPRLRAKYSVVSGRRSLYVTGGLAYGVGRVRLEEEHTVDLNEGGPEIRFETDDVFGAEGFGAVGGIGIQAPLQGRLSLEIEAGYQYLDLGDLEDGDGEVWRVPEVDENLPYVGNGAPTTAVGLDLSGPYLNLGLTIGL